MSRIKNKAKNKIAVNEYYCKLFIQRRERTKKIKILIYVVQENANNK